MASASSGNLIVVQGGGPTVVVNASLGAIVSSAKGFGHVYGACYGVEGLLADRLVRLDAIDADSLRNLAQRPGAALGSSRRPIAADDYDLVFDVLARHDVTALIMIGGNGMMAATASVDRAARRRGADVQVVGVPKTVDNDLEGTDRCPGYGSAARFVAQSVRDVAADVETLPVPVSIFETMGRDTGWLAGSSILARPDVTDGDAAPHGIYLPESPFDLDELLARVDRTVRRLGWAMMVVAEGLRDAEGRDVFRSDDPAHRDEVGRGLPGNVAAHLADAVGRQLGLRCRNEKPGLCGRTAVAQVSTFDRVDAEAVGRAAVVAARDGQGGRLVALTDERGGAERETRLVPLAEVGGLKSVPSSWIDVSESTVRSGFIDYVRPLIGGPLVEYPRLDLGA